MVLANNLKKHAKLHFITIAEEAYYYSYAEELYRAFSILVYVIFILKDNRNSDQYYISKGTDYQVVIDIS